MALVEGKTPVWGVRYPLATCTLDQLPLALAHLAADLEAAMSSALASFILGTNYVQNPGAEGTTLSLEVHSNATITRSNASATGWPRRGGWSYLIASPTTAQCVARLNRTERPAAQQGQRWHARAVLRTASANTGTRRFAIVLRFYDQPAGSSTLGTLVGFAQTEIDLPAGAVGEVAVTALAPAGTLSAHMSLERTAGVLGAAANDAFYADELLLTQTDPTVTSTPAAWDGSTADTETLAYRWTGAENASTSIKRHKVQP